MGAQILSVAMVTYNHANYIKQAIDSILAQKVNFDYEIVIGDDCSTDQTPEILREYRDRYPDIITLILREKNLGTTRNTYEVLSNCKGEYIAILEGDDFWTDKNKLQIQVDFLNNNKSYIACTHRHSVVDEDGGLLQKEHKGPGKPGLGEYSINDFENYIYPGHIGTVVFRNIFISLKYDFSIIYKAHKFIADTTICGILAALGNIYVMDYNMSSYRSVRKKGGTNYVSTIAKTNFSLDTYTLFRRIEDFCTNELEVPLHHKDRVLYYNWWSLLFLVRYPSKHNLKILKEFYSMVNEKNKLFIYVIKQVFALPAILIPWLMNKIRRKYLKMNKRF